MLALLTVFALAFANSSPAAVQFDENPGWHVGAKGAHTCVGVPASRCSQALSWASTTPLRDCAGCVPHKTLAKLPANGILIHATRSLEKPLVAKQKLAWPPVVHATQVNGLEGLPARIGVYQRFVRVGDTEVMLFVFFGRSHPTAAQLKSANAELRSSSLR